MTPLDEAACAYMQKRAEELNLSARQVGIRANIPTSTFDRYWKGDRSMTFGDLRAVIAVFGDSTDEAMNEIERIMIASEQ